MSKSLSEYLPTPPDKEVIFVQGKVSSHVVKQAQRIMSKRKISWSKLLTACLRKFVDDTREGL